MYSNNYLDNKMHKTCVLYLYIYNHFCCLYIQLQFKNVVWCGSMGLPKLLSDWSNQTCCSYYSDVTYNYGVSQQYA